jgi:hypothetical protein
MTDTSIEITTDAKALLELISVTQALLELGNFPLQFLGAALDLLDSANKIARIASSTTLRAGITISFELGDALLALVAALRTGNLDSFFLEHHVAEAPARHS